LEINECEIMLKSINILLTINQKKKKV